MLVKTLMYFSAAIILLLMLTFLLTKWRVGVLFLFLWLVVEGVVRRRFPQYHILIFFVKDVLVAVIYFAVFHEIRSEGKYWKNPLLVPILVLLGISIIQAFNPNLPSYLIGFLGLKTYFYYIPLLYAGYWMFNSEEELFKFWRILMLTAIPVVIVGIYQLFFPGLEYSDTRLFHTVRVRSVQDLKGLALPASTFFGIGRFALYMLFLSFIGAGIIGSYEERSKKLIWLGLLSAILGIFIAGRRSEIFTALFLLPIILILPKFGNIGTSRQSIIKILLPLSLLIPICVYILPQRSRATYEFYKYTLIETPKESFSGRLKEPFEGLKMHDKEKILSGYGIGLYAQGVSYLGQYNFPSPYSDSTLLKIMLELSIFGLIIFAWLMLTLLRAGYLTTVKLKASPFYPLSIAILGFQVAFMIMSYPHGQKFYDSFQQIYLWFISGVLFGLPRIVESSVSHEWRQIS